MPKVDVDRELMLSHKPPAGPFVVVNMFRMKEGMQLADFFKDLAAFSTETAKALQGETIYSGKVGAEFTTGETYWDYFLLVRFKDWEHFRRTVTDGDFISRQNALRRKYLEDYSWVFTTPLRA